MTVSFGNYPHQLGTNEVFDLTLSSLSSTLLDSQRVLSQHEIPPITRYSINNLLSFQQNRGVSSLFNLSHGLFWDAEIILRSFYEAHSKILYICLGEEKDSTKLSLEFWNDLFDANSQRNAARASPAFKQSKRRGNTDDARTYERIISDSKAFTSSKSRPERQRILQNWAFNEILRNLGTPSQGRERLVDIESLSHMYSMQSHLCHADSDGLGLIEDHESREPLERVAKERSHFCRICSDVASLWLFTSYALCSKVGAEFDFRSESHSNWEKLHEASEKFKNDFSRTQDEFYRKP